MKERVALINPAGDIIRTGRLVRRSKIGTQSWPPIYLAYATGVLEKLGYECMLFDAAVMKGAAGSGAEAETYIKIKNFKPDFVALYWSYDTAKQDLKFADIVAQMYNTILVGPWSAHLPDALDYAKNVKLMTFGEFEYTLPKIISGQSYSSIQGLKYREDDKILFNPQREPYSQYELDWMPFVSDVYKRHLDISAYHQTSFRHPFIDIFSARSCPHRCAFCSWINGMDLLKKNRYQQRSLKNVMNELWFIKQKMPEVKQLFFQDSTLTASRAKEISLAMIRESLKLCWGAYSRADKTFDLLFIMKEAGCRTLHVGYEVPIQSILNEIRKDITVEQEAQFIKDVNKLKLWTSSSFMIFPWMTEEQIKYMVKWIKDNNATRVNVAQLQTYPNVPIVDVIAAHKDIPNTHIMDFEEMKKWEQYCFKEFYVKNPKFWLNVVTNPRELKHVARDAIGMLKFFGE